MVLVDKYNFWHEDINFCWPIGTKKIMSKRNSRNLQLAFYLHWHHNRYEAKIVRERVEWRVEFVIWLILWKVDSKNKCNQTNLQLVSSFIKYLPFNLCSSSHINNNISKIKQFKGAHPPKKIKVWISSKLFVDPPPP